MFLTLEIFDTYFSKKQVLLLALDLFPRAILVGESLD
jgi:hypothetical protein